MRDTGLTMIIGISMALIGFCVGAGTGSKLEEIRWVNLTVDNPLYIERVRDSEKARRAAVNALVGQK